MPLESQKEEKTYGLENFFQNEPAETEDFVFELF